METSQLSVLNGDSLVVYTLQQFFERYDHISKYIEINVAKTSSNPFFHIFLVS